MNIFNTEELELFSSYKSRGIEMRGIWHMPYTLNNFGYDERTLSGIVKLLDKIKEVGFNTIFIETTVGAYTIYPSKYGTIHSNFIFDNEPYGPEYKNDYLLCFISEAHKRNISVHAWTTTMRAGKFEESLEKSMPECMKPEWLARGYHGEFGLDGRYGILMWLDASNPEVIEYLINQYEELVSNYDIDGIELDAIRYPVSNLLSADDNCNLNDFGYTEIAIKEFRKVYNFNGDLKSEILNNIELKKKWIEFRSNLITNIVYILIQKILSLKPNLPISAAVFLNHTNSINTVCQNWKIWLDNEWVDFISPMAYTLDLEVLKDSYFEIEYLANDKTFNLQGLGSIIIEGGTYLNHFQQISFINKEKGFGSILFSIRQFLKDKKMIEMMKYIYNNNPVISPIENVNDIILFVINHINDLIKPLEINLQFKPMVTKKDYDEYLIYLINSKEQLLSSNVDKDVLNIIDALMKVLVIKSERM